jgi:hypothetical protein
MAVGGDDENGQKELERSFDRVLHEVRTILPGVQALLGFQLVAVFNQRFAEKLTTGGQLLHFGAALLLAGAMALLMAPAAYHRRLHPRHVTASICRVASRLITMALAPLMAALAVDVYLVAGVVGASTAVAIFVASLVFALLAGLWYAWPEIARRRGAAER